jgi:Na+/H+-dicarboxylate symporter
MVAYMLMFWLAVRGPVIRTLSKLSNPNVLAFMTNNPVIALPAALETLTREYGVDRRVPDLVIPFGIFANQHGAVFLLSFLTIFLAQIYVIDLDLQDYVVVAIGSIIAGATGVGGGAVLIPTVAPILGALRIPTPLALVVLATTDNSIGPVRTVLTLQSNITLTVMTANRGLRLPLLTAVVLDIDDLLLPDHVLAIAATGDHQVCHCRVKGRTVPVVDVRRAPDGFTLLELDDFPSRVPVRATPEVTTMCCPAG